MLKLAIHYKDKLQVAYSNIIYQDKYKYFNTNSYWNYEFKLVEDSWNKIEMVSVDSNDNVIGFFRASIDRDSNKVMSLGIMNFYDINIIFSRDMYRFIHSLLCKFDFRKIEFEVVIGNPAEKMYDKFVENYGGRIIGISKENVKLHDGQLYDTKYYEIFKKDIKIK